MFPWRLAGAIALSLAFFLMGRQIQRLATDQPWSDANMWLSIMAGAVAGACVLVWTWFTAVNARRLVEPARSRELPDPKKAVTAWLAPFAFVAIAIGVVASLGEQISRTADEPVSSLPVFVAVGALLIAIPLTYRPLYLLSGMIRQVGGHSARLSQWMWVPVALAIGGVGSIVALRFSSVFSDGTVSDASQWAPLWLVGLVVVAPCVIVVLLAWRAAATVEEALQLAGDRRRARPARVKSDGVRSRMVSRRVGARHAAVAKRKRVRLIPGVNLLRLTMVALLAGQALLTLVGAIIMFLFWREANDGTVSATQGERAWDAMGVLHTGARVAGVALIVLASLWTLVAVTNARMTSARRRNPLIAALSWPAVAFGIWTLADRLADDPAVGATILVFAAQAALLYVPFFLLERTADVVGARRAPLRVAYGIGVVILVYLQTLGGLTTIEQSVDANFGRLAGFLALGALVELLSTLAVSEACRAIESTTEHEANLHNALVEQREAVTRRHADASSIPDIAASAERIPVMGQAP